MIEQNKAFIVTNCTEQTNDMNQRLIFISRNDTKKSYFDSDYTIHKFTIRKEYAYVNDIVISSTFKNIIWAGTNAQYISFLVTTPINSILTSSFLDTNVTFIVEKTNLYPTFFNQTIEFDKITNQTRVEEEVYTEYEAKYFHGISEYSNCSINTDKMSITLYHNAAAPKGRKYDNKTDTDFLCGEE